MTMLTLLYAGFAAGQAITIWVNIGDSPAQRRYFRAGLLFALAALAIGLTIQH